MSAKIYPCESMEAINAFFRWADVCTTICEFGVKASQSPSGVTIEGVGSRLRFT
jgi:hypothetical protein